MNTPVHETLSSYIDACGGRRFILTLLTGFSSSLLVWFGKIAGTEYTTLMLGTVAVYIAGNTYQKREQIKVGNTATDSELKSSSTLKG